MLKKIAAIAVTLLVGMALLFAATGDTLTIGGAVPLTLDLVLTAAAGSDNLTLHAVAAAVTPTVGSVTIVTNSSAGWELWVQSTNADGTNAMLTNADGDSIDYTIGYTRTAGTGTSQNVGAELTNAGLLIADDTTVSTVEEGDLVLSFNTAENYPAGYYSDLLTVTIRAK